MASVQVRRRTSRDYPPLLIAVLVMLGILVILPSSLNMPQTNPAETLEYAPVPPEDDVPPSPSGNLGSLSLAGSSSLGSSEGTGPGLAGAQGAPLPGGAGKNPSTKRCVGDPPRQTEDPLSPPCVAHFEGDNFGATYPGVTREEVRVVFYGLNSELVTSQGKGGGPPPGTIVDLAEPPPDDEYPIIRLLRAYQQHFNNRYQTYGRFVHFYAHFPSGASVEGRRADAIRGIREVDPFAVITVAMDNADAYVETMTRRRVVTFIGGNYVAWQPADAYRKVPGLLWSYSPSVEQVAQISATYMCEKVVPHETSFGDPQHRGKPRVLGLIRSGDQARPDHVQYGLEIKEMIEDCGGTFAAEMVAGPCCFATEQDAADLATFRQRGVTTVIWTSGRSQGRTSAASSMQYFPEWVIAGTNQTEGNFAGRLEDQAQWQNARAVTTYPAVERVESQPCYTAAKAVDPELDHMDIRNYGCDFFLGMRQLFIGIQVAGPRLAPPSIDRGFHAIPRVASTDPSVPACFYDANDYSCVKDAQMQWWDPSGEAPDNTGRGCWRMMQSGRRYLAGTWPDGDVDAHRTPDDPCNLQARDLT